MPSDGGVPKSSTKAPYATATSDLLLQLRQLVAAPPHSAAVELLTTANGALIHDFIVASLLDHGRQAAPLTELEALTAIVRLLAVGTGDPNGETVTPDSLDPSAGDLDQARFGKQCEVAQALRSQAMAHVILDLLARRGPDFERGECLYLRLEALKALRLVMTPEGLLHVGAPHEESSWWAEEEDLGYLRNGDTRRRLVEAFLCQLQSVGDTMGQKPKVAVLGSLWSLAGASSYIRTRILQSGGEALVASLFRAQIHKPPPHVQAALVVECGVLTTLVAGSRTHERHMAKLGVDRDVVEMLRRFNNDRQIVCAGLVLLTFLANDDSVAARLADSPEALAAISAARKFWPEDVERALKRNVHYVSPAATAVVRGSAKDPLGSARRQRETPRGAPARSRPVRAAAVCVVGGSAGRHT